MRVRCLLDVPITVARGGGGLTRARPSPPPPSPDTWPTPAPPPTPRPAPRCAFRAFCNLHRRSQHLSPSPASLCTVAQLGSGVKPAPPFDEMNSGARDAAQTGHKRQATNTGRHVACTAFPGITAAWRRTQVGRRRLCRDFRPPPLEGRQIRPRTQQARPSGAALPSPSPAPCLAHSSHASISRLITSTPLR